MVAGAQPLRQGSVREPPRQVSAGECVARTDGVHDVDLLRRDECHRVADEDGGSDGAVLDDELRHVREERADVRGVRRAPQRLSLVAPGEDDVGAPRQRCERGCGIGGLPQRAIGG